MPEYRQLPLNECVACHKNAAAPRFNGKICENLCEACAVTVKTSLAEVPPIYWKIPPRDLCDVKIEPPTSFLTLYGASGTRKTATACDLLKRTAYRRGLLPMWIDVTAFPFQLRAAMKNDQEESWLTKRCNAPLALIDDIGGCQMTDYTLSAILRIVKVRGEFERLTIVTSNLSLDEIKDGLDARIADRLRRFGPVMECR